MLNFTFTGGGTLAELFIDKNICFDDILCHSDSGAQKEGREFFHNPYSNLLNVWCSSTGGKSQLKGSNNTLKKIIKI